MFQFPPGVRSALVERTAAGVSLADACGAEGLRLNTVKGWLRRGRQEGEGEYADFARAVDKVRHAVSSCPTPMGDEELARVVSQMARRGSVQAAKLRCPRWRN